MNKFLKNSRKLSMALGALLLAITLTAGSFAFYVNGLPVVDAESGVVADENEDFPGELEVEAMSSDSGSLSVETMSVTPVSLNMPSQLRGAYLVPGADFIKQKDSGADTVYKEIDKAVADVVGLDMTAVVIDTVYSDKVIYSTSDSKTLLPDADIMKYLVDKCRDAGLFVSAIFDASPYSGGENLDKLSKNANEFAAKYRIDSVLIDGYTVENPVVDYNSYIKQGGSIGLENYKLQASAAVVRAVANAVHKASPDIAAGLLADAVWANKSDNDLGSATNAKYTSLYSGYADTKTYVERRFVDFVAVKAYSLPTDADEPFGEVVSWWNSAAEKGGIPMYVVHASDKIGTTGWTSDQLTQQTASISHYGAYRGSIFNNLQKLASATPSEQNAPAKQETSSGDDIKPATSNNQLAITPLSTGNNQVASNSITLIKEISPTGLIMGSTGDYIEITALAYIESTVTATINGKSIRLSLDESSDEGDSEYGLFAGEYIIPESGNSYDDEDDEYYDDEDDEDDEYYDDEDDFQVIGGLSVRASYGGRNETMEGAYMATSGTRTPVQITADQAKTYPAKTKNNVPISTMYPLPKGTIDYAVGKTFSYTSEKKVKYTYVVLESGVRVETKDLKEVSKGPSKNNKITALGVSSKSAYTYIALKTDQKVPYTFAYKGDSVEIIFSNTTKSPASKNLASNPMFTKATWSDGNKLTLKLVKSNGFMGYKGYYDSNGNLVFRFNNPPESIKKAKIAIDPGHGGKDIGAPGSNSKYPEKVLTRLIADKVAAELESRGAEVYLMKTEDIELLERVQMAEKWGADILLSIHCNSSTNKNAAGTEVFYFYPFSKSLATSAASSVSKGLATANRGAKLSYYHMTLSSQMTSVLVECGFMTNKTEYSKLTKSSYHKKIATGIADAAESAIKAAKTGVAAPAGSTSSSTKSTGGGGKIDDMYFEDEFLSLAVGATKTLKPTYEPENADNTDLTWKSSRSSVVSVDENGKVKGIKEGTATVTATTTDGSKISASVEITVGSTSAASSFTDTGISLSQAGEVYLTEDWMQIYPGRAARVEVMSSTDKVVKNASFKWKSSDTSVATVDSYGVVTAKSVGNAEITATASGVSLLCDVEVSRDKVATKGVRLDKRSIVVVRKETAKLVATVEPTGATDKGVTWSSSNSGIASVDSNGVITAKNTGKCTITVKTKSGGYKATCDVEVVLKPIEIDYIELYETLEMQKGDVDVIDAWVSPSNATDTRLTYKSSNTSVVSIDKEGNIKALKKGTATITVTASTDKSIYATCKITVYD